MDSAPAKRRKLDHSSSGASSTSRAATFALATEELLRTEKFDKERFEDADDVLYQIKSSIEQIDGHEPLSIHDAATKLEKRGNVRIPVPDSRRLENCPYKVAFARPTKFNVVGSYFLKTLLGSQREPAIDMICEMPAEMLQQKDYLDMRYFFKRAYFLAVIAESLQEALQKSFEISYELLHENALTPVIAVRPKAKAGRRDEHDGQVSAGNSPQGYRIRVIPCVPDAFFPVQKLKSSACLDRKEGDDDKEKTAMSSPTPFYNSTLKSEGYFTQYLRVLRQAEKICSSYRDACVLGRIWLQQRGFGGSLSEGGFGHFEWAALLALLLQGGGRKGQASLSASLTSVQLFKAMIQFLSMNNFAKKPCILGSQGEDVGSMEEPGPVLFDSTRLMNLAFKMSPWSADFLNQYARSTQALMSDPLVNQFTPTFIIKTDMPLQSFDALVQVKYAAALARAKSTSRRGPVWDLADKAFSVLKRGLGDKARCIHIRVPPETPWSTSQGGPVSGSPHTLQVGILHNSVNMPRKTDRGPLVEDRKEAENFRKFWGEKSELRRFKDGTTCETLLWNGNTPDEICEEIVRYLLGRHLRIGQLFDEVTFFGKGFVPLVPIQTSDVAHFSVARKEFGVFEQDIRNLEDLPLYVRQLQPVCPELRFTSLKAPTFEFSRSGPRPMEVIIDFEASGKWPENLCAIQHTKIALLSKLGSLLEVAKPGLITTYLGLEDARLDMENLAFLDVVYESGSSFRLRVSSDLEETLLERRAKDKSLDQHVRTESATLLATFRRLYTTLPLHTQAVYTYTTRFPALSGAVRLLKQWFNSHKLTWHFTEEFLELVALQVFMRPYPWDVPSSPNTAFLRALLLLARWDWRTEPLVVDTSGEMSVVDQTGIETRMEAWRKLDPNMNHTVLFVATSDDGSGTAYTTLNGEAKPSKVVASRMTALARSATNLIKEQGFHMEPKTLFVPSLKDYDVLIHLNKKAVKSILKTFPSQDGDAEDDEAVRRPKFKNLDKRTGQVPLPLVQHPSNVLLTRLNAAYPGPLVFFHGADDDLVIGGIWNPQMQVRSFRINLPCSYKPIGQECKGRSRRKSGTGPKDESESEDEADDLVEINKGAIVAEISRIGGDLIDRIDAKGF